jgi:hypothetical protein
VGGASSSSPEEIRQYAKNDAELILEQLSIYKPDIIICCGLNLVADCLADYVFKYEGKWEHCPEIYDACCWFYTEKLGKNTAVLNCYHPLNLGTGLTNIELFEAIKRILPRLKQNALI